MNEEELKNYEIGINIEKFECPYCKDKLIVSIIYDLCCEKVRINPMTIQYTISQEMQKHIEEKHPNKEIPWLYKFFPSGISYWRNIPINERTFSKQYYE